METVSLKPNLSISAVPVEISNGVPTTLWRVCTVAALFFIALGAYHFIRRLQDRPSCPPATPLTQQEREAKREGDIRPVNPEVERLRSLLKGFPQDNIPDELVAEFSTLVDVNYISPDCEERLRTLLIQLYAQIAPSQAEIEAERRLKEEQDKEYEIARAVDLQREAAYQRAKDLCTQLTAATATLLKRSEDLEPHACCLARFKQTAVGLDAATIHKDIQIFEERHNVNLRIDLKFADDLFKEQVKAFNQEFTEDSFAPERKQINKLYDQYTAEIPLVNGKLKWAKMKEKLTELGPEEFVRQVKEEGLLSKL